VVYGKRHTPSHSQNTNYEKLLSVVTISRALFELAQSSSFQLNGIHIFR
jgi:hypothetical protein